MCHHCVAKNEMKIILRALKVGKFQHRMILTAIRRESARVYIEVDEQLLHVGLVN